MKCSCRIGALAMAGVSLVVSLAAATTGPQFILLHGIRNDGTVWDGTEARAEIAGRSPCLLLQPDTRWKDRIPTQAIVVRDALETNDFQNGVAIGYSQGGLVAREYFRQNPTQTRIRSLITMGTGHLGAPILGNLSQLPDLFFPIAFVVADAALADFGYLITATGLDGLPYFSIHWNSGNRPVWAQRIANALVDFVYFKMVKPVKEAPSSIDQTPGSPFLAALNGSTTYQAGIRRASIQGVEWYPELYLLGASALGLSDDDMIAAVNALEYYAIWNALNAVLAGSYQGFAAYFSSYILVNQAPHQWRKIVGQSPNLAYDQTSDGVVPAISQVMPDAEPNDGSTPLLYRADKSNHLDHMHDPNVLAAMRSALSTFGDTGPPLPSAPTNVRASDNAGPAITIDWDDVQHEQNYLVYRDGAWIATLAANVTHYVDNAACNTHTYVIASSNCSGVTNNPAVSSDVGSRTLVPPPVPTNVVASDCGTLTYVRVGWTDVAGEDGYRVLRGGVQIAQVGAGVTQYDDATGTPGQVYAYSVKSYRTCDGESAASASDNGCRVVPPPTWLSLGYFGVGMHDHTMVYDDRDRRMLSFGGRDFTGPLNDIWEYSPNPAYGWTRLWSPGGPNGLPSPREHPGIVYSPNFDVMLAFGGESTVPWNGDLWQLDLTTPPESGPYWYRYNSLNGPVYEGTTQAVYDPVADRMIVAAPYEGVFALSITGGSWTKLYNGSLLSMIGPAGFQAVYDAVGDRLLIFGGTGGTGLHSTVWAMPLRTATPTWSALVTTGLSEVSYGTMTWDPEAERVLLYGGTFGPSLNADVWALKVTNPPGWSRLVTAGTPPAGRFHHGAAYDLHSDRLMMSGGISGGYTAQDAWALTFPDYTAPAATPDFYVDAMSNREIWLAWTNTGDDGAHGTASLNDIRMSMTGAITAMNFSSAAQLPVDPPLPAGSGQQFRITGLLPCTRYWFAMKTLDEAGNESPLLSIGSFRTLCVNGTAEQAGTDHPGIEAAIAVPARMEFARVQPNPASSGARLSFGVPADRAGQPFEVGVFDVAGRAIRSLDRGTAVPGRFERDWDLRDQNGGRVGNGVYYVRFLLGDASMVQRVAVTR